LPPITRVQARTARTFTQSQLFLDNTWIEETHRFWSDSGRRRIFFRNRCCSPRREPPPRRRLLRVPDRQDSLSHDHKAALPGLESPDATIRCGISLAPRNAPVIETPIYFLSTLRACVWASATDVIARPPSVDATQEFDHAGGGSYVAFPGGIAESLYKAAYADPAEHILERTLWSGQKLPYCCHSMVASHINYRSELLSRMRSMPPAEPYALSLECLESR